MGLEPTGKRPKRRVIYTRTELGEGQERIVDLRRLGGRSFVTSF